MTRRDYQGPDLDATYQHISERPELDRLDEDAEDVVYATEAEQGEETTENVPIPGEDDEDQQRPLVPGQTTLTEWGVSCE
ncbi:hypothetical protein [Natronococcus occultus]|uniref:Uncharacterized protein n=1 Tax=Natronococcus occultus SP4 TaxID=694430 RepID=L0K5X1_9EURY|nr:hypothetical protein [Natronococcus occultus]AGB39774.1 hypothetical protein Natoc_4354 [Natronococcus occultus SP4]